MPTRWNLRLSLVSSHDVDAPACKSSRLHSSASSWSPRMSFSAEKKINSLGFIQIKKEVAIICNSLLSKSKPSASLAKSKVVQATGNLGMGQNMSKFKTQGTTHADHCLLGFSGLLSHLGYPISTHVWNRFSRCIPGHPLVGKIMFPFKIFKMALQLGLQFLRHSHRVNRWCSALLLWPFSLVGGNTYEAEKENAHTWYLYLSQTRNQGKERREQCDTQCHNWAHEESNTVKQAVKCCMFCHCFILFQRERQCCHPSFVQMEVVERFSFPEWRFVAIAPASASLHFGFSRRLPFHVRMFHACSMPCHDICYQSGVWKHILKKKRNKHISCLVLQQSAVQTATVRFTIFGRPKQPLKAGRSDKGRTWKPKVPAPVDNRAEIAAHAPTDPTLREFHGILSAINCHLRSVTILPWHCQCS